MSQTNPGRPSWPSPNPPAISCFLFSSTASPVPPSSISSSLGTTKHPLIGDEPARTELFRRAATSFRSPIEGRFHAVLLRRGRCGHVWAAPGQRRRARSRRRRDVVVKHAVAVSRGLSRQTLAETRFGQEHDPLQHHQRSPTRFADRHEGKLIIANTRKAVCCAPEMPARAGGAPWPEQHVVFRGVVHECGRRTGVGAAGTAAGGSAGGFDLLFELRARAPKTSGRHYVVSVLRNVTDLARAKEEIEDSYRTLRLRRRRCATSTGSS